MSFYFARKKKLKYFARWECPFYNVEIGGGGAGGR
jgi:hypothetical protein